MVYRPKTFPNLLYFIGFTVVIGATWFDYHYQVSGMVWEKPPAGWGVVECSRSIDSGRTDEPIFICFSSYLRAKESRQIKNAVRRTENICRELERTQVRLKHF